MIAKVFEEVWVGGLHIKESKEVRLVRSFDPNYDWKYYLNGEIRWIKNDEVKAIEFQEEEFEI